jgi:hypothetical protein
LPASAVVQKDNDVYCFQVRQGKAAKTPLQIGLNDGQRVEVLKIRRISAPAAKAQWMSISGKETIVKANVEQLADGQQVVVKER